LRFGHAPTDRGALAAGILIWLAPDPYLIDCERCACGDAQTICPTVEDYSVRELLTDIQYVSQSVEANEYLPALGRA
jgi:hypothetical protein